MRLNIASTIVHWGVNYPNKKAITVNEKTWTYGELLQGSESVRLHLQAKGISQGDRVAVVCHNCIEYVEAVYGCLRQSATLVPLDFLLRSEQLARMITDADCSMLMVHPKYPEISSLIDHCRELCPDIHIATWPGSSLDIPQIGRLTGNNSKFEIVEVNYEDIVSIFYSSGTTGKPKGIVKNSYQIVSEVFIWIAELGFRFEDCMLIKTPMYYTGGILLFFSNVFIGGHLVILDTFDVYKWLRTIQEESVTHAFLSPTQTKQVLQLSSSEIPQKISLRLIMTMSDITQGHMKLALANLFGCAVIDMWGNTEGVGTIMKPQDLMKKPDSIGKPFLTDSVRIVDNNMQDVQDGEIGEIIGKSDNSFVEYHKRPDLTEQTIRDGWILSGDLGWRDSDGFYYFAGRKKEIIKFGSATVYPRDIEEILEQHPAVREAAVYGIEEEDICIGIAADVILKDTDTQLSISEQEILEWINSHVSTNQRLTGLRFQTDFPRAPAGKVIKAKLMQMWLEDQDEEIQDAS